MKNSFILYKDQREIFDSLNGEQCKELIIAIFDYPDYIITSPMVKIAFVSIKNQLERDNNKYENICKKRSDAGVKGNRKRWGKKNKIANAISLSQNIANIADNDNDNDNDKYINTYVEDTSTFISSFNSFFKSNYQVTRGRIKKMSTRRKTYTLSQILLSVKNLSLSDFHRGKNERGWIASPDFLLDTDERIDKWLNPPKTMNNKNISEQLMEVYQ